MSTVLDALAEQMETEREHARQTLVGLAGLANAGSDADVIINGNVFPSINKVLAQLEVGGLQDIRNRQGVLENMQQGLIQQAQQLAAAQKTDLSTVYWRPIDLSAIGSPDINSASPLFSSKVEQGLRFPFDAFSPKQLDRQFGTDGLKIGNQLIPPVTDALINLFTSALPAAGSTATTQENVAKYNAFTRTITTFARNYYRYYYGWYYWWYRSYWAVGSYVTATTSTVSESINNSIVAQTFKLSEQRVLLGVNMLVKNPGGTKSAANPSILICNTRLGMPVLSEVLARGTLRDDSDAASLDNARIVKFDLDRPILLSAEKSYAIVIRAAGGSTWNVWHNANELGTGQVFFTQDGEFWSGDLAKDFILQLRTADFGVGTTQWIVNMGNLSVSGGISSIDMDRVAEIPSGGDIEIQVEINAGTWQPVSVMDSIASLPANINVRGVFTGSRYAMPILDTQWSVITAFRPATTLRFFSQDLLIPNSSGVLKIIYNLAGFDSEFNTFTPKIKTNTGVTVTPTSLDLATSEDGNYTKVTANYTIPAGTVSYSHDIAATTQVATKVFDIVGIVEMKQ